MEYKRRSYIILLKQLLIILLTHPLNSSCIHACKYTPGKIPPKRHKIHDRLCRLSLYSNQILLYLRQMLMGEKLVYRNIVAAVTEMSGLSRLLSCTGRTGDGSHMDLVVEESCCRQRQGSKLYCRSEATWIGNVMRLAHLVTGAFAKPVDEMSSGIIAVKTEIIAKVNDPA